MPLNQIHNYVDMEAQKQTTSQYNEKSSEVVACNYNTGILPHLVSFEKMLKLPVLGAAWNQSQDVYGKVKCEYSIHDRFRSIFILFLCNSVRNRPSRLMNKMCARVGPNQKWADSIYRFCYCHIIFTFTNRLFRHQAPRCLHCTCSFSIYFQ